MRRTTSSTIDQYVERRLRGLLLKRAGSRLAAGRAGRVDSPLLRGLGPLSPARHDSVSGGGVMRRPEGPPGKPCAGNPHARFERGSCSHPVGHRLETSRIYQCMHSIIHAGKRLLILTFAAALFVVTVSGAVARRCPERGQPFRRNTQGLGPSEDRLGRSGSDWHLADFARPQPRALMPACRRTWTRRRSGSRQPAAPAAPPCDPNNIPLFKTEAAYTADVERALGIRKAGDNATQALAKGDFGAALQGGVTDPTTPVRQSSTIVDPPNGKLPELTPEGKRRSALMRSSWAALERGRSGITGRTSTAGTAASRAACRRR